MSLHDGNLNSGEGRDGLVHFGAHPEPVSRGTGETWPLMENPEHCESFGSPRHSLEASGRSEAEGEEAEGGEEGSRSKDGVQENSQDRRTGESYGETLTDVLLPRQHPSSLEG